LQGAGGIGGMLARSQGYSSGSWTTHHFYHADGNGNITYLVNSSQTLGASYKYNPFGGTISSSGIYAGANRYRFSSKEVNVSNGTYYYGYRWYHPNLQRWLNRDPVEEDGGINLFRFVQNSPMNKIDALGLSSVDDSIRGAIVRGDVEELEALLDENIVTDGQASTIRNAIAKFRSKASDWIAKKCKGSINQEFPSELRQKTLQEIRQGNDPASKKAWKLINDKRFRK
jgi:RHS repeat-associated protein